MPNKETLGQTHIDNSHSYTRYTTKELYTILEFLKNFNKIKHKNNKLLKFSYTIKIERISKNKNFRVWVLYAYKK